MNLEQFKTDDGVELYIDVETGASFASQSGYARMADINRKTVYNRINAEKLKRVNLTQITSKQDLDPAQDIVYEVVINNTRITLLNEEWIVENIQKDNPELAKNFTRFGVRATMHKMAGFEVKSEKKTFDDPGDMIIAAAEKIKHQRIEIKQLESQLGNAKQKVKDNLERFEQFFDENASLEYNVDKFGKLIIEYKQEITSLEYQNRQFINKIKDNVNHFFWEQRNNCNMSEGERRAFGRLITKICNRYGFNFDERTNVKNGQDLNVNHYPVSLLQRIFDLVNSGNNYAYIFEQFSELDL